MFLNNNCKGDLVHIICFQGENGREESQPIDTNGTIWQLSISFTFTRCLVDWQLWNAIHLK